MFCKFFCLSFIIIGLAAVAMAQEKNKLPVLPATASLAETQKWLEKGVKKFGKTTTELGPRIESSRIEEFKFEGCKLTYRFVKSVSRRASDSPDRSSNVAVPVDFSTVTLLDLADIDPANISLRPAGLGEMQTIGLVTLGEKNSITYKSTLNTGGEESGTQNRANFIVKDEAAEQIKGGFLQAIKLCQAAK